MFIDDSYDMFIYFVEILFFFKNPLFMWLKVFPENTHSMLGEVWNYNWMKVQMDNSLTGLN